MNYVSRYGLEFNPFIKNSKEILYENNNYKEVKARLDYLLQTKGIGLITGDPGCGKTTIVRNYTNNLNQNAYKIIYLPLSTLTVLEAYKQLAIAFNIEPFHRKYENFAAIQDAIRRLNIEKKIIPIIIFDEANYLSSSFLNDIKILFNFEMDSRDLAVVLLVGQSVLNNALNMKSNEALRQRIITSYNIGTMSIEESCIYIKTKLSNAGSSSDIFTPQALRAIASYSSGNPRVISRVCDLALMIANKIDKNNIDDEVANLAINEINM